MHQNSYDIMARFVKTYVEPLPPRESVITILDVGSCSVQAGQPIYRTLFENAKYKYFGLDLCTGNNVDLVSDDPYKWPLEEDCFDVVISGQCLEHTEAPWLWIKEVERVCKPGGLVSIIAPWMWGQHRYPLDCWRVLPDGMTYLLSKWASFDILDVGSTGTDGVSVACDCWGMARKRAKA